MYQHTGPSWALTMATNWMVTNDVIHAPAHWAELGTNYAITNWALTMATNGGRRDRHTQAGRGPGFGTNYSAV